MGKNMKTSCLVRHDGGALWRDRFFLPSLGILALLFRLRLTVKYKQNRWEIYFDKKPQITQKISRLDEIIEAESTDKIFKFTSINLLHNILLWKNLNSWNILWLNEIIEFQNARTYFVVNFLNINKTFRDNKLW